ncbi:Gldg family protein, partial [bacterium]|nr:Gldg family protein [bacterium]
MKRLLSKLNRITSVVFALVVVLLVNVIALTNPFRIDLSGRKYYSLSEKTINLLEGLEDRVDISVLFQEESALYMDIENLLEEYQYRSRNIYVEWIDPVHDLARTKKLAEKYGLTKAQVIVFSVDGKNKVVKQSDLANVIQVKGQKKPVLSAFKGEQAFSSAIQGLVQGETPVVYFLVGHGERRVTEFDPVWGYSRIGTAMFRDNLEIKELMLTT